MRNVFYSGANYGIHECLQYTDAAYEHPPLSNYVMAAFEKFKKLVPDGTNIWPEKNWWPTNSSWKK